VIGPFGYDHAAALVGTESNGSSITASYQIPSDYVSWDGAENGSYTIVLQPNQVKDVNGNTIAAGSIGTFDVAIAGGTFSTALDLSMIDGTRLISDSVDASDTTDFFKFSVGARSTVTIAMTGLLGDANILLVDDANNNGNAEQSEILGFPNLLGVLPETIATTLDPGTYYLWLYRVSGATTYSLAFTVTALAGTPTGTVNTASVAVAPGGASSTFLATYVDDSGIKISTIGDGDMLVRGPNGFSSSVTLVSTTSLSDGPVRGAKYRFDAPGGLWESSDNGIYSIYIISKILCLEMHLKDRL